MKMKDVECKIQYPYFQGQIVKVRCGIGFQFAVVVEDCGQKYAFGSAKWDYVRVRKYHRTRNTWAKTIIQVDRADVAGVVVSGYPKRLQEWIDAAKKVTT